MSEILHLKESSCQKEKYIYHFSSQWLGLTDYSSALELQNQMAHRVRAEPGHATILGVEHFDTITIGIRGNKNSDLLLSPKQLIDENIKVIKVRRGGQTTFHSPGQLVIYPILPIGFWGLPIRSLVSLMLETTKDVLHTKGIFSQKREEKEVGVYTEQGKIAFIGLNNSKGVTTHGLAINVCNQLNYFKSIRSCGVSGLLVDSLLQQGVKESPSGIFKDWLERFFVLLNDLPLS